MATIENEISQRKALADALVELEKIKPEELAREDALGTELSFRNGVKYFDRTHKLFLELSEIDLELLPYSRLNNLTDIAKQALSYFNQVQTFSVAQNQSNIASRRETLINQIRDFYDGYFEIITPIVAYCNKKGSDVKKLEGELRENGARLKILVAEQEQSRAQAMAEIESTLDKIRKAAQQVGVAQHAIHFKAEADDNLKAAGAWLFATVTFAVITVLFGVGSYLYYVKESSVMSATQGIQLAFAKLFVFSALFTGLIWTGKIYKALRHNYVVNKHRQNALSTFEAFVKAAADEQTKSHVLMQATQCIFASQNTGYVSHDNESSGYPQVLEIVRNMASPSK